MMPVSHPFWWDASEQLENGDFKPVKTLPSPSDPSNHCKPDPKRIYRVTIIVLPKIRREIVTTDFFRSITRWPSWSGLHHLCMAN
jgi:hypothetical protein